MYNFGISECNRVRYVAHAKKKILMQTESYLSKRVNQGFAQKKMGCLSEVTSSKIQLHFILVRETLKG